MKKMKKCLSFILAIVLLASSVPLNGFVGLEWPDLQLPEWNLLEIDFGNLFSITAKAATSGTCGENLTWVLDDDGSLTISGVGEMTHYSPSTAAAWYSNRSSIKKVIIEDGVTSIGDFAFRNCTSLTSVTIPHSVTNIGTYAFIGCTSLNSFTIPGSVISIENGVFAGCSSLSSVTIPDSVTIIGEETFDRCRSLTSVKFPDSLTSIGKYAFSSCTSLLSITIPDSEIIIGDYAFCDCTSLNSITIPDSVKSVGHYAFNNTAYYNDESNWESGVLYIGDHLIEAKMEQSVSYSYTIKEGTKTIAESAFDYCNNMTSITIPDTVTIIGAGAFAYCTSLTSITIPANVTNIGSSAFICCLKLKSVIFEENSQLTSISAHMFEDSALTSIIIPDGVTQIEDQAFWDCAYLTSVTIPDTVKSIGNTAFRYCIALTSIEIPASVEIIGNSAFHLCSSLTEIKVVDGNENYTSENGVLFNKNKTELICYPISKQGEHYVIPDTVKSIGDIAFCYNKFIVSLYIPDTVNTFGEQSFRYCESLQSITIPPKVKSIAEYALKDCPALAEVNVKEGNSAYSSESGVLYDRDKTTLLYYPQGKKDNTFSIPSTVTAIDEHAFNACPNLKYVYIPDNVTEIGIYAFYNCSSLQSVHFYAGSQVKEIKQWTFMGCSELRSIVIPVSIKNISYQAFLVCTSLTDVYYMGSEADWKGIKIDISNTYLKNANRHYGLYLCQFFSENGTEFNYQYIYSDSWFAESSSKYNHNLCIASAALAYHAGTPDDTNTTAPLNAIENFKEMGFDTYTAYGYSYKVDNEIVEIVPDFDSIACIIGSKEVNFNGINKTIVAVAIRGMGYRAEWGGNFNIGKDTDHTGFDIAATQVMEHLNSYLSDNGLTEKNVIYWITGYSRAAATANLVAARLTDGGDGYENIAATKPKKNSIFGYMFATPNNTTDKNADSTDYDNIFNIINPIDIVPTLAPEVWEFNKYGVCYFLPAKEYTPRYAENDGLYEKMQESFYSITGTTYKEDFDFYELGIDVEFEKWYDLDVETGFIKTNTMGQMTYINNLTKILATDVLSSRTYCVNNYQSFLQKTAATYIGGWNCKIDSQALLQLTVDTLNENFFDVIINPTKGLSTILKTILAAHTNYTVSEIDEILTDLAFILLGLAIHPNYLYTTLNFAAKKSSSDKSMLMATHEFENYMSWLALVGQDGIAENNILTKTKRYKNLIVNCPVNVNVYDSDGTLVASIVDNQSVDVGSYSLSYYVDANGQKIFSLPNGEEYRVEMIATDTGSVNCSIQEIGADGMTVESIVNFETVQVEKGDVLICDVIAVAEDDGTISTFTDQNGDTVDSVTLTEAEIQEYTITVTSDPEGGFVLGGGTFITGEFAQMTAYETEEYIFLGWYDDELLVSTDKQYRFAVTESKTFTARFDYKPQSTITLGDVDGNGEITSSDARTALRAAVGLDELTENQQKAADADKNGEITSADARLILRASVGLENLE